MSVTEITDHEAEAIARLPSRYRELDNIEALLRTLVAPIQELENSLIQMLTRRGIETGTGVVLDQIGVIVGEPRGAAQVGDDEGYRPFLRGRIASNRSQANVESLIRVARAVVNDADARVVATQPGIAATVVRVADVAVTAAVADALIYFLRDAKKAGVRLLLESSIDAPDETFTLDEPSGSARGLAEGILVAVDSTFNVAREDVGPDEPVVVPAGQYSHAEMIALIQGQLLGALTFDISAGLAQFEYLTSLLTVTWGTATGLRDALGWTADIADWDSTADGPAIAPSPPDDSGTGGTLSDVRE